MDVTFSEGEFSTFSACYR